MEYASEILFRNFQKHIDKYARILLNYAYYIICILQSQFKNTKTVINKHKNYIVKKAGEVIKENRVAEKILHRKGTEMKTQMKLG